ncbi:MAG: HlyD family efflux transporter periplasmic adaptor subunit [Phycisphaeraceae bacterium]|nr:HlyD family efflux transporter periplasmic adaptor subunit [Phycisphaeraceae bacterium]
MSNSESTSNSNSSRPSDRRPPRHHRKRRWTARRVFLLAALTVVLLVGLGAVIPTDRWLAASGYVMTHETVELRSSVEGVIDKCQVASGDLVKVGQVLVQLQDSFEQASYEHAASELKAMRARLNQLKSAQTLEQAQRREQVYQARRNVELVQIQHDRIAGPDAHKGAFSQTEIDQAALSLDIARSRLTEFQISKEDLMAKQIQVLHEETAAAAARLAVCQTQLESRKIRAVIKGVVYFNTYASGEVVKPENVLGQVFNTEKWVVSANIPEREITNVRVGQRMQVAISAYPRWIHGYVHATVTKVTQVVTPRETGDGIFAVQAALEPTDEFELHPGMSARCFLNTGRTKWLVRVMPL